MQPLVAPSNRGLGTACLALLLTLTCMIGPVESSPAHAAGVPNGLAEASISAMQPAESSPVPKPARRYALDMTPPNSFPNLGSGLREEPQDASDASPDGSYYKNQFQAASSEPAVVIVESTVFILGSNEQADQRFGELQEAKRRETGARPRGVGGWRTDRVSTYQTARRSGDGTAGVVLRYRNAVGLVEIRGGGQYATADNAKILMGGMLRDFKIAVGDRE